MGLTKDGKLFQLGYHAEQKTIAFANLDYTFTMIQASLDGNSLVGISSNNVHIVHWEFGHDHVCLDQPFDVLRLPQPLEVVKVQAGQGHFMLLTKGGDVYTWSIANIGQAGTLTRMSTPYEEMTVTSVPTVVAPLKGIKVTDIACGGCPLTGDSFNLALTDSGVVYSWGDGDFGKLGRGGSDGSKTPRVVDKLQGMNVEKIYAGGQFSAALCKNGALYTWGKGNSFRLGHGSEEHVRYPKMVEALLGKRIAHVAPGHYNMVIVTEDHQVIGWGANDFGQLGANNPSVFTHPTFVAKLDSDLSGLCCGPQVLLAWTGMPELEILMEDKIPFVLDPNEEALRYGT